MKITLFLTVLLELPYRLANFFVHLFSSHASSREALLSLAEETKRQYRVEEIIDLSASRMLTLLEDSNWSAAEALLKIRRLFV
jgi:hypothetical protein